MQGLVNPTRYDLRFQVFDIPVRVHPIFWIYSAILGWDPNSPSRVLTWVALVLVSVLVHELGHGIMSKLQGLHPRIVLYMLGGVCISERQSRDLRGRLEILFAGPGAGLGLAAIVSLLAYLTTGVTPLDAWNWFFPTRIEDLERLDVLGQSGSGPIDLPYIVASLIVMNIFWSFLNLLPLYPLDGGQITHELLTWHRGWQGKRLTHQISIGVGVAVAIYAISNDRLFLAIFFGFLAYTNYQLMKSVSGWSSNDPTQWWRQ